MKLLHCAIRYHSVNLSHQPPLPSRELLCKLMTAAQILTIQSTPTFTQQVIPSDINSEHPIRSHQIYPWCFASYSTLPHTPTPVTEKKFKSNSCNTILSHIYSEKQKFAIQGALSRTGLQDISWLGFVSAFARTGCGQ